MESSRDRHSRENSDTREILNITKVIVNMVIKLMIDISCRPAAGSQLTAQFLELYELLQNHTTHDK